MRRLVLFLLPLILSLHAVTCLADVIYLKNGDRLTGTITNMEDSKLLFWTKFAGEITLFWQDVERFEIDDTAHVILKPPPVDEEPASATPADANEPEEETTTIADAGNDMEVTPETEGEPEVEQEPPITPEMVLAINPKPPVPVKITTAINTKLSGERGNTHKDISYFNGKFTARTEWRRYLLDGEYSREKKNTITTEDDWFFHSKFSQFVDKERYIYLDTLFENDKFKDLKLRSTYGIGAGYQFAEEAQVNLSFSLGVSWVSDEYYLADGKEFSAGQWAIDFDRYFFRNRIQLFHSDKGYISFKNKEDWLVKSKTGLRVPLYGGFTASLQYEYEWDNEPASDAEVQYDSTLLLLFGYEFKN